MDSVMDDGVLLRRVSPFGNLRIVAYVPLPEAYRSLSRPSSAPDAKAFPLRSFSLNLSMISHLWFSELCRLIRIICLRNCYPNFFVPQLKLFPSVALLVFPLFSFQCAEAQPASWWAEVDSNHRPTVLNFLKIKIQITTIPKPPTHCSKLLKNKIE